MIRVGADTRVVPFSPGEYARRLALLRAALADRDFSAVLLSDPASVYWLTGFRAEWYVAHSASAWLPLSGVVVTRDAVVHLDIDDERPLVQRESVAVDIRTHPSLGEDYLTWYRDQLRDVVPASGRVAVERHSHRPHAALARRLDDWLTGHGHGVEDGSRWIRALRRHKSDEELVHVREASRLADIGLAAAERVLRPGVSELQVYGAVVAAMADAGGEPSSIPLPVISGPRAGSLHALASDRRLEPGDLVNVDVCGVRHRYHVNKARCYSIGAPSRQVADVVARAATVWDVVDGLLRPGLPAADLLAGVDRHLRDLGLREQCWWLGGYELGASFPPDWVGELVVEPGADLTDVRLSPGTVMNWENSMYLPDGAGVAMNINTILVDDTAAGVLPGPTDALVVIR
jgi:Xaa-Pro aminopeptidase